ncbi:MAG TPA: hypothetical protein VJ732_02405, partial [Bryobacteraceae bacterium]|nr:hypothetical protein [Bryobacteraceae bacterium]
MDHGQRPPNRIQYPKQTWRDFLLNHLFAKTAAFAGLVIFAIGTLPTPASAQTEPAKLPALAPESPTAARALLDRYCVVCHNDRLRKA